jgi:hypothetical protein
MAATESLVLRKVLLEDLTECVTGSSFSHRRDQLVWIEDQDLRLPATARKQCDVTGSCQTANWRGDTTHAAQL